MYRFILFINIINIALFFRKLTTDQQRDWIHNNQNAIKELGTKAFYRLEQWSSQAEMIERKFRQEQDIMMKRVVVFDWLKNEVQDIHSSYKRGQQVMIELQRNLDSLLEQTNLVKSNVKLAKSELEHLAEDLEVCIQDLALACKRQERSKSKLVAALSFGGLGDMPDPNSISNENSNGGDLNINDDSKNQVIQLKKKEDDDSNKVEVKKKKRLKAKRVKYLTHYYNRV